MSRRLVVVLAALCALSLPGCGSQAQALGHIAGWVEPCVGIQPGSAKDALTVIAVPRGSGEVTRARVFATQANQWQAPYDLLVSPGKYRVVAATTPLATPYAQHYVTVRAGATTHLDLPSGCK